MDMRALDKIIAVKPEPQTTPSLAQAKNDLTDYGPYTGRARVELRR